MQIPISRREEEFRLTLGELCDSLSAPVVLTAHTDFTIHLAPHFAGLTAPRSLLPAFAGNRLVLGTLPDPTFGDVIAGLARTEVEPWLD